VIEGIMEFVRAKSREVSIDPDAAEKVGDEL